jgi:hypothetical protein
MLAALVLAASAITTCPAYIEDKQSLAAAPAGWESRVEGSRRNLSYADVHWGAPPVKGPEKSLQPIEHERGVFSWGLDPMRDHWVVCHYRDSAIVLIRPIGRMRDCTFTKGTGATPSTMACRPIR